jgi:hypothetical protein
MLLAGEGRVEPDAVRVSVGGVCMEWRRGDGEGAGEIVEEGSGADKLRKSAFLRIV